MGNVILGSNTYCRQNPKIGSQYIINNSYPFGIDGGDSYKWYDSLEILSSTQIGVYSASLNGSDIVGTSIPLNMVAELRKSGYKHNLTKVDNVCVGAGSTLRVVLEEKSESPFVSKQFLQEQATSYNSRGDMSGDTWDFSTVDIVTYIKMCEAYNKKNPSELPKYPEWKLKEEDSEAYEKALDDYKKAQKRGVINFLTKEAYEEAKKAHPEFFKEWNCYHTLPYLYFGSDTIPELTNSYTAKIYIDYD